MAASLVLACFSCGIEEYVVLESPKDVWTTTTTIEFKHNTDNDDPGKFIGYDVYYRLFATQAEATASLIGVDDQLDTATPDTLIQRISTAKYQKLIALKDLDSGGTPMSPIFGMIDEGTNLPYSDAILVKFNLDENGDVTYAGNSTSLSIRRNAINPETQSYRNFSDISPITNEISTSDCAYTVDTLPDSSAYFRGYIFAIGVFNSANAYLPYYSIPVLIGKDSGNVAIEIRKGE